jgi:hypothetical protein
VDLLPQLRGCGASGDLNQDLLGDGGDDVVEDLLILGVLSFVHRIRDQLIGLLSTLGDLLRGHHRLRLEIVFHLCTTNCRQDLQLPEVEVSLRKLL